MLDDLTPFPLVLDVDGRYIETDYTITCRAVVADRHGRVLDGGITKDGYRRFVISNGGKRYWRFAHRLLLNSLGERDFPATRHLNNVKLNNSVSNLAPTTRTEIAAETVRRGNNPLLPPRRVNNLSTGEVYESIRAAASAINRDASNIREAIDKNGTWGGYRWQYLDPPRELIKARVVIRDDGKQWPSVSEATREIGCNPGNLSQTIKRGSRLYGHHYRYAG